MMPEEQFCVLHEIMFLILFFVTIIVSYAKQDFLPTFNFSIKKITKAQN